MRNNNTLFRAEQSRAEQSRAEQSRGITAPFFAFCGSEASETEYNIMMDNRRILTG